MNGRARVAEVITDVAPSVVVNASSGNSDWAVTADGAVRVALVAVAQGCRLVHVSSDAVFSGAQVRYDESFLPGGLPGHHPSGGRTYVPDPPHRGHGVAPRRVRRNRWWPPCAGRVVERRHIPWRVGPFLL